MIIRRICLLPAIIACGLATLGATVRWDGAFLETTFSNSLGLGQNSTNQSSVATSSGGNVAHYPGPAGQLPSASYLENGRARSIQLRQSVVGHAAASSQELVNSMLAMALTNLKAGVTYTELASEIDDHRRVDGQPWNIRFSGVVNPVNTNDSGFTYVDANFFPERTKQSAEYYRAALRVDPLNKTAAHGLLRTYYERMAALTYAGHNGAERAARIRLLFGDINWEISNLENYTLNFYQNATEELNLLTSRPLEAQLFDGSYPYIDRVLATNRNRLTEAYARALSHQAETIFQLGRLKQFNQYANPLLDTSVKFTALLGELATHRGAIAERQLLLDLAADLSPVGRTELARCRYYLDQIQSLESTIENGRIGFVSAHNEGTQSQPLIRFTFQEYSPDYVPFHALTTQGERTHDQFIRIAEDFRNWALQRQNEAIQSGRAFDAQTFEHQSSLSSITNRYFQELSTLCGQIRDQGSQGLVPDVILALYPLSERVQVHSYDAGESTGEIGQQWRRIEEAQDQLEIAEQDLEALYAQMEKKSEVAGEMTVGIENLASLFLENGDTLKNLDLAFGNLQAEAAIERARLQQGNGWWNAIKRGVTAIGAVVATYYTGGATAAWAASAVQAVGVAESYNNDNKSMKAAKIEARLSKNLAKINAQRTRIATLEKVALQYHQRDQLLLQTEEALHGLLLQTERQKLTILLAEQRVGSELLALQNLIGRVQFLLQEFASALALQERNPLNSPDYRLIRDLQWREAEDAFHLTHRWVYLAAKSVEYRLNSAGSTDGSATPDSSRLQAKISAILRARNASTLDTASFQLKDELNSFYSRANREVPSGDPDYLSVRHHLVQRNRLNPTNDVQILDPELQPGGLTSSNHWQTFLQAHVAGLPNNNVGLVIPFSTSFDPWTFTTNALGGNPLFSSTSHGDLLDTIEVQVVGRALTQIGQFRYGLLYQGTSTVRQEECLSSGKRSVRYWNIRRPDGSAYRTDGPLGINSWQNTATSGFREFSPANDRWLLEITTDLPNSAGNRNLITTDLSKIEDIRIRFRTHYFPADRCN